MNIAGCCCHHHESAADRDAAIRARASGRPCLAMRVDGERDRPRSATLLNGDETAVRLECNSLVFPTEFPD
jgi:hypothetical protein